MSDPARSVLVAACEFLPVFPLPRVVLMPGALLPLHVFEPRYRALIRYCMAGSKLMGVATLRPGYQAQYHGRPEVHPELGIGMIVAHQELSDGRSNVVLKSVARSRVLEELDTKHAFRVVRAELSDNDVVGMQLMVGQVKALVLQVGCFSEEAAEEARRLTSLEPDDMIDALARRLLRDPAKQRSYIGTDSVAARALFVQERLAELLSIREAPSYDA